MVVVSYSPLFLWTVKTVIFLAFVGWVVLVGWVKRITQKPFLTGINVPIAERCCCQNAQSVTQRFSYPATATVQRHTSQLTKNVGFRFIITSIKQSQHNESLANDFAYFIITAQPNLQELNDDLAFVGWVERITQKPFLRQLTCRSPNGVVDKIRRA